MFEPEGGENDGWVEAEIQRELSDLAHLTLQDLELEEDGCHGDREVWYTATAG